MMKAWYTEMKSWNNVTETFSDKQRHYKDMFLETCEVFDEILEVSLFSSTVDSYEIYFSYGIFYGIIYVEEENAAEKYETVKNELELEYRKRKNPTTAFINEFAEKYGVSLPNDIFFDFQLWSRGESRISRQFPVYITRVSQLYDNIR